MKKIVHSCALVTLVILFLAGPAAASINSIAPGNVVFIGEQGLDITNAMQGDTQIGWWASGASTSASSPDKTIQVSNPASFSISPSDFGTPYTGAWYHLNVLGKINGPAFTVVDPNLAVKVMDATTPFDATNKWVPTGDQVQFEIDTNLYQITQRFAVSSVPITIKVQSPNGGTFDALINQIGMPTSIVNFPVTTNPQLTGPIWDTGRRDSYPAGTYTIWVECNVNGMMDNYGITGKTVSSKITMLDQDVNPLISGSTTVPTVTPVTTRSTIPSTPVPTTQVTSSPTYTVTANPTSLPQTVLPTPLPTPTRADGFGAILAGFSIILGLAFFAKKE